MGILYFHTEMYYAGTDVVPYSLYVDGFLSVFFFISGYLFVKDGFTSFDGVHKLKSIFRRLIVPYFAFTTIMSIPKAIAHGQDLELLSILRTILTGEASWFVAALIVAELLLTVLVTFFRSPKPFWAVLPISILISAIWGNTLSPQYNDLNFWNINEAVLGCFFLSLGILFRFYEASLSKLLQNVVFLIFVLMGLVITKYIIFTDSMQMVFGPITIDSWSLFITDNLLFILLFVALFRKLPYCKWLSITGQRSIVFYFFCGGIPLIFSRIVGLLGLPYSLLNMLIIYPMVYAATSFLAFMVYKYIPWLVGAKVYGNKE